MSASSTARIRCAEPGRYAKFLTERFARSARTEWNKQQGRGSLMFAWGKEVEVDMIAGDGVLLLHLECPVQQVEQLEAIIGIAVVEIGDKEELHVQWRRAGGTDGTRWTARA
ncbi:DUF2218 domain-containing protein [Corynebacterium alimapuense]|uniref:DUF2218 domain-containing protein n=1 Tax=Corynebacterium alimapuense TaxID=1576874 RepID=A0A3M8K7K1_9CORY|nr:DUF2218 domain-containing protein [Corynebacterium alimapuense]RNE48484.1 DUF2218 domain-containing protein [Corynebacterium alimapuense]